MLLCVTGRPLHLLQPLPTRYCLDTLVVSSSSWNTSSRAAEYHILPSAVFPTSSIHRIWRHRTLASYLHVLLLFPCRLYCQCSVVISSSVTDFVLGVGRGDLRFSLTAVVCFCLEDLLRMVNGPDWTSRHGRASCREKECSSCYPWSYCRYYR